MMLLLKCKILVLEKKLVFMCIYKKLTIAAISNVASPVTVTTAGTAAVVTVLLLLLLPPSSPPHTFHKCCILIISDLLNNSFGDRKFLLTFALRIVTLVL